MAVTVSSKTKDTATRGTAKRRSAKQNKPSEDEIRILAYDLYEQRQADGLDGDATSDWIEAERQLERE